MGEQRSVLPDSLGLNLECTAVDAALRVALSAVPGKSVAISRLPFDPHVTFVHWKLLTVSVYLLSDHQRVQCEVNVQGAAVSVLTCLLSLVSWLGKLP